MDLRAKALGRMLWPLPENGVIMPYVQKRGARGASIVAMIALALMTVSDGLSAQSEAGRLDLPLACNSCQIRAERVLSFQAVWATGGLPSLPYAVSKFATDNWVILDGTTGIAYRFDDRGRFLGNVAGLGHGPGELAGPSAAFRVEGDSTFIIDGVQRRISVFDPDGRFRRSFEWSGGSQQRVMLVPSGGFVVAGRYGTRSSFGMPFHEFNRGGSLLRSFGSTKDVKIVTSRDIPVYRTPQRTRVDGSFWSVEARSPHLRLWRQNGSVADDWRLPLNEFAPLVSMQPDGPTGMEFFTIEEISPDVLLISIAYREDRYQESYGRTKVVDERSIRQVDDYGRFFSTRVFALDVRSRSLLASEELDAFIVGSLGDGLYWTVAPGGDGGRIELVRLRLDRQHSPQRADR